MPQEVEKLTRTVKHIDNDIINNKKQIEKLQDNITGLIHEKDKLVKSCEHAWNEPVYKEIVVIV